MSKLQVLQLVQAFSLSQADPTASEKYYRDIIFDLGQKEILTNIAFIYDFALGWYGTGDYGLGAYNFGNGTAFSLTGTYGKGDYGLGLYNVGNVPVAPTGLYKIPDNAIRLLGAIYDDKFLNQASIQEAQAFTGERDWQSKRGQPAVLITEDQSKGTFKVFPTPPSFSDSDTSLLLGPLLGTQYPHGAVVVFFTETRQDVPVWLELPIAFEILNREFSRESDHKDDNFALACHVVSQLLFQMVL